MADVRVDGLAALEKALNELPEKIERNIVRSALRAGLKGIRAEAQARVPVRSGELRNSIRVTARNIKGKPVAAVVAGNKKAWYGHFIEFGTGSFYQGVGGNSVGGPYVIKAKNKKSLFLQGGGHPIKSVTHPGSRAQPFMRPAFDAGYRAAIDAFALKVRQRLTKEGINIPDEGGDE